MDRLITIERATFITGTTGQRVPTWATLTTLWAKYESVSGAESPESGEYVGKEQAKFTCHWYSGLKASDRIKFDPFGAGTNTYWNIKAMNPLDRNQHMMIMAIKRDNQ